MKKSKHAEFPIILISKPGTLKERLGPLNKNAIIYSFFESGDGRKILLIHGNPRGTWPDESREAIEEFCPTDIYCCYPKSVRWATGDNRVTGNHDSPTTYIRIPIRDGQMMFTLDIREESLI